MNKAFGTTGTVNSRNNQGGKSVHEIGHALNLYHTFEGDRDDQGNEICQTEDYGCGSGTGDCCDDTEPHKRSSSNCPSGINEFIGINYAGVQNNFLDYLSQACKTKFTQDQKDRMIAALTTTHASLLTLRALSNSFVLFTGVSAASCSSQFQAIGLSDHYAGIISVTFGMKAFASSTTAGDNGYIDNSTDCIKTIEVVKGQTYSIGILGHANTNYIRAWIDYDNDGSFSSRELIHEATIDGHATSSESVTIPTTNVTF